MTQAIIKGDIVRLKTGTSDIRVTAISTCPMSRVRNIRGRYVQCGRDVDWRSTCDFVKVSNSSQERTPVGNLTLPKTYTADTCPDGDYFAIHKITGQPLRHRYRKQGKTVRFIGRDQVWLTCLRSSQFYSSSTVLVSAPHISQVWDKYLWEFKQNNMFSRVSDEDQIKRAEAYIAWVKAGKPTE